MTVLEVIQRSGEFLGKRGVDSPRLQIELMLAHLLRVPRLNLYLNFERELSGAELESVRELVRRRGNREPLHDNPSRRWRSEPGLDAATWSMVRPERGTWPGRRAARTAATTPAREGRSLKDFRDSQPLLSLLWQSRETQAGDTKMSNSGSIDDGPFFGEGG